ncbi:MAG: hypothetical protein DRG82_04255 [Deltaproteobacteria bacterium]|nr:MAG: hypothetical protein DRG82_04255 [Deltaproteobacteria bacterium]
MASYPACLGIQVLLSLLIGLFCLFQPDACQLLIHVRGPVKKGKREAQGEFSVMPADQVIGIVSASDIFRETPLQEHLRVAVVFFCLERVLGRFNILVQQRQCNVFSTGGKLPREYHGDGGVKMDSGNGIDGAG